MPARSLRCSLRRCRAHAQGDNFRGQLGVAHRYSFVTPHTLGVTAYDFAGMTGAAFGAAVAGENDTADAPLAPPGPAAPAASSEAGGAEGDASAANATSAPPAPQPPEPPPQASYTTLAQFVAGARVRPAVTDVAPARVSSRHASPVLVGALSGAPVVALAAGGAHSAALTAAGEIWTWGDNRQGQLGLNYTSRPFEADLFFQRRATARPVMADRPQRVRAWDYVDAASGQLVTGSSAAAGGGRFVELQAGVAQTAALTAGGAVWLWGGNAAGGLGTCGCGACAAFYAAAGCAAARAAAPLRRLG